MLNTWCKKIWLYVLYFIGLALTILLFKNWTDWIFEMKFVVVNAIILPFHVFEEWQFPAGFHYQYNLIYNNSKYPNRYPMNRLIDMITNFSAELFFLLLLVIGINKGMVLALTIFSFLEVVIHTLFGIKGYYRFKEKGKKTIYGPGSVTAYAGFGISGVIALFWLIKNGVTLGDCGIAAGILFIMLVGMIFIPENLLKKEDNEYAFSSAGYFEKFLR